MIPLIDFYVVDPTTTTTTTATTTTTLYKQKIPLCIVNLIWTFRDISETSALMKRTLGHLFTTDDELHYIYM